MKRAKKEIKYSGDDYKINSKNEDNLQELLINWQTISKDVLNKLNAPELNIEEGRDHKSIMALGAMEAHINMAMQAFKASENDQ